MQRHDQASGLLIVLTGPSGSGKSTLLRDVFAADPRLAFSVSCTTRPPRPGEVEGESYYFVSDDEFDRLVADDAFLEWASVHTRRYGTKRSEIDRLFSLGHDIVFDIDTVGAFNIRRAHPEAVLVFILPPSLAVLEARLRGRKTETDAMIAVRLENAKREIAQAHAFDYLVTNATVDEASAAVSAIIKAERHRTARLPPLHIHLLENREIA
jgi:guanylate kinase